MHKWEEWQAIPWEAWRMAIAEMGDVVALIVVAISCLAVGIIMGSGLPGTMVFVAGLYLAFRTQRELKKYDPGD